MRKLMTAFVATAAILAAGSVAMATPVTGAGLLPLTNSYSPIKNIGCWCGPYRCACGHPYGYYGGSTPMPTGPMVMGIAIATSTCKEEGAGHSRRP
jgi:hypothetical protein